MATQELESRIDRFAGLSDRAVPIQLTRIENPDLRNVEFSSRALEKRNGFSRVHSTQFKDSSVEFDGNNDFIYIRHQTRYQPSNRLFVSFDTILTKQSNAEMTCISVGYGTGANRFLKISYDPTANSNNGAWRMRARDSAGGGADRDVTVNDGTGTTGAAPYGVYRHIELVDIDNDGGYTLVVYDSAGTVIGTSTEVDITWITLSVSTPWWIGVDTNGASGTVRGTDYYGGIIAEIRIADAAGSPNCSGVIGRELYSDPSSTDRTGMVGYWKLNDGQGPTFADTYTTGTNNPAIAGGAGHRWITNSSLAVLGTALEFYGAYDPGAMAAPSFFGSFVWWQNALAVATTAGSADPFTSTLGGAFRNWCVDCIYVPRMAQGETTVRNQTILWAGTDATNPAPVGIRVVSNRLQGYYWDGTTLLTLNAPAKDLSELIDTRLHIGVRLFRHPTTATIDRLEVFIRKDSSTSPYYWSATTDTADPAINPTSISGSWGIGDKLNSTTAVPPTSRGDNAFGIIQNVAIRYNNALGWAATPMAFYYPATFIPQPILFANVVLAGQIPLDDGQTNYPRTTGAFYTVASLYPDPYDGFHLAEGLVTPADAPYSQLLCDWRRIDPDGNIKRSALVVSGSTFYDVDLDAGTATVRVSGIPKSTGPYTCDQYGTDLIIAGRNGIRPFILSDNSSHLVGIEAPQTAPVITSDTASGSIPSGTYTVYVTYRNGETTTESNPSPAATFTLGATGRIDAVALPISADPHVNQRRIWVTAAGGGTAYLQATVYDNSTTSYTTDITTIATTTSLDLTGHEEAPIGSLVAVWKDRLWVAGNNLKPTRIYFSAPGNLSAFNHTAQTSGGGAGYLDADLDTGDVCVALKPMLNQLVAYFRDGIVEITATGDTTDPFFMTFKSKQTGAVGPLAVIPYESGAFYAGERDFFLFDGFNSLNISSPTQEGRPSIQQFVRNSLEPSRRKDISLAIHRSKNQLWASCSLDGSTRNDCVLVFDFSQGIWSRYGMDMDSLLEIEDDSDEPWIYGTSRGFVVKLDTGSLDGSSAAVEAGTATGGTTSSLVKSTANWTANAYKGMYVWWYDVSATTTRSARIYRNTTTTLFFADTTTAPESGDLFGIGIFPWYADFIIDYGNPLSNYKLKFFLAKGESDTDNNFRLAIQADVDGRTWSYAATEWTVTWASTDKFIRIPLGGVGRSFRMRVADTGLSTATGSTPAPSVTGKIGIFEMALISERMEAR